MKRVLTICAVCLAMSTMSIAQAQGYGMGQGPGMGQGRWMGRNMPTFEEFDLDKSGFLDKDEFIEARDMRISDRVKEGRMMRGLSNMMQFEDIDLDKDGKVTPEEFAQGVAAHHQQMFQ